jgi:hypothetical protein
MTVRGPIASLPLVAEPGPPASPDQLVTQTARYDNPDNFFGGFSVFPGAVTVSPARFNNINTFPSGAVSIVGAPQTVSQIARFDDPDTYFAVSIAGGDRLLTQNLRFDDPDTFFSGSVVLAAPPDKALTQTARFNNLNLFFGGSLLFDVVVPPIQPPHPSTQVGFPPDGSGKKKKPKQTVRIKWRDTVAEAEARLVEEQRLAEIAQLQAFEAYLIRRRKIAAATALLLS